MFDLILALSVVFLVVAPCLLPWPPKVPTSAAPDTKAARNARLGLIPRANPIQATN
jgi:hypothetical protein